MSGDEEPRAEESPAPLEPRKKTGITDLIDRIIKGKGKMDPMTFMLVSSELRRQERDERRAEREDDEWRERKSGSHDSGSKSVDFEKLMKDMNEGWESRFEKQQERIEKMFMGKKLEDTEERAKAAEKKLEEKEEKEEQEKLVDAKVGPLAERIGELQVALAEKTAGMTKKEKKDVFADIGEKIREKIGGSVGDKIADTITASLDEAFTTKEGDEIETTKEGKVDYAKETFKTINKGLSLVGKYVEKMPAAPPEVKEVQKMPPVKELTPAQQRLAEKIRRGEELVPPPAPAEVREVVPKEEKAPLAPPPKKVKPKPKEEPAPTLKPKEKKPPPTEKPKEEKQIVKEPPKPVEEKKEAKPVAKPKPKEKPKEEKKPVLPVKEKLVKLAEKTKEKPSKPKQRAKTTEKSLSKQTS